MTENKITLELNEKFDTFEEAENAIKQYGNQVRQVFVRGASTSIRNSYLRNSSIKDGLEFIRVTFVCKFSRKKESKARIRTSSTYDHDCPASITLKISKDKTKLEISDLHLVHENHAGSEDFYHAITENRRLSPKTKDETLKVLALGAKNKLVKNSLAENNKKLLFQYDIYNLKAKLREESDNDISKFDECLRKNYGCSVKILRSEQKIFKGLYFSTPAMTSSMASWPSIVFVDSTYGLFNMKFPLIVLLVQDGNKRAEIVGCAIVANESKPILTWVAKTFKETNGGCEGIQCMMTDKDLTERAAFKVAFPDTPMYLCLYHVLKAQRAATDKMHLDKSMKIYCLEMFEKLAWSAYAERYNELYAELIAKAPPEVTSYFNENWHSIRDEWPVYTMTEGTLGNRTNNPLESMNGQIQTACGRDNTLCGFARKFFSLIHSLNQETDMRVALKHLKNPRLLFTPGSIQQQYADCLLSLASIEVHKQLELFTKILIRHVNDDTKECEIQFHKTIITATPTTCSCYFQKSYALPCRHIFAVRKKFDLSLFDMSLCHPRWTKEYQQQNHRAYRNANPGIQSNDYLQPTSSTLTIETLPQKKFLSCSERRKEITTISQDLITVASLSTGAMFDQKRSTLLELGSAWRQGKIACIKIVDSEMIL